MKKCLNYFFAFSILLILWSCAKDEEVMTGTINGFVSDYTNANSPIAGATVTINSKGLTKTTGSDGRFEFDGLEPGTYSIAVQANNYQATTKQVTVYAGQIVNCDFQLEKGAKSIEIDPLNIVFGRTMNQASFTITNNTNGPLSYSISNYPDYIQVLPASATISAKGKQAVGLSLINRSSITTARNAQLTVNVGSDSYIVSINVEPWADEKVNVDINPQSLSFDSNTEQLFFTMTSNNSFANNYTLSTNLDVLTLSQESGTLLAKGQSTIAVSVKNRKEIDTSRNGQITINIEGNTYIVSVHIDKYVEGGGSGTSQATDVVNGLYAYYTFEGNYNDQTDTELSLVGIGTSFTNSYDGSNALKIPAKTDAYISIPEGLVDQPRMSISFWVKDLDDGHVFHAVNRDYNDTSFLLAMIDGRLRFIVTRYNNIYQFNNCPSFIHNNLDGWHMITLVSDFNQTEYSTVTTRLYVDGKYTDVVTEGDNVFGESEGGAGQRNYRYCTKFIMGGEHAIKSNFVLNATSIIIDNLRFYKYRCLSADEVKNIYNFERQSK